MKPLNIVKPRALFPKTVPILAPKDFCKGHWDDVMNGVWTGKSCLEGWLYRVLFDEPYYIENFQDPASAVTFNQRIVNRYGDAGYYRRMAALDRAKTVMMEVIKERSNNINHYNVPDFNDHIKTTKTQIASVWNETMRRLGYVEEAPEGWAA